APHKLSGGQKQRVAVAGIIAMKPQCIVLDEPTAMLDPSGRKEVIETVKKLNREENITIVLITHYMDEAVEADRVIVVDSGEIKMDDTPENVFARVDEVKALGLDVPQSTELIYRLGLETDKTILNADACVEFIKRSLED
ncbi:MAG: ATP-binding cassette domain-containing protein, partial [Eubacterium sp.]|nr:ATP-binding cassette domain-containing protein [Eubacterium sp.]